MSEESGSTNSGDISELVAEAREAAKNAHAARQKADDDASYAHNAKVAAEEHSKAAAALKAQAEVDGSWFTTTRQGVEQAQATVNQIRADAESAKQTIAEATAEVEKARGAVKTSADQAEAYRAQAEKAGGEADSYSKAASASHTSAAERAAKAEAAETRIGELLAQVTEQAATAKEQAEKVTESLEAVKKAEETAAALVASMAAADKKAAQVLSIIEAHEADLSRLKGESDKLHARIESLLPNATSAGLATAFREQQARFVWPQWMWLATFVVTIGGLLASSLWGLPATNDSWDSMGRHFVNRLPLIAPLVWLAIYAGRHYQLALRLQEEYAYKEAVSAAFEGYKREMGTVGAGANGGSPLVTLCENVLSTLGQRPGRIYEGKQEDITPANTFATAAKDFMEAAKELVKAATGKGKPEAG